MTEEKYRELTKEEMSKVTDYAMQVIRLFQKEKDPLITYASLTFALNSLRDALKKQGVSLGNIHLMEREQK